MIGCGCSILLKRIDGDGGMRRKGKDNNNNNNPTLVYPGLLVQY